MLLLVAAWASRSSVALAAVGQNRPLSMMKAKKNVKAAVAVLLVLVVVAVSAAAQERNASGAAEVQFKHNADITSVYDKANNQTILMMDWYDVYRGILDAKHTDSYDVQDNRIQIKAGFIFPGRGVSSPPESVEFGIKVGNQGGPKFQSGEMHELHAIVDGETISLGKTSVLKSRTYVDTTGKARQVSFAQLSARFTFQGLLRIVQAKKVIMTVGQLQFDLKEANLEALRDLANRVVR